MENNQQMFDREFLNMFILHLLLLRSVAHTHLAVARTAPAILQRYSTVALRQLKELISLPLKMSAARDCFSLHTLLFHFVFSFPIAFSSSSSASYCY